jgi:hypothetical protein
MGSGATPMLTDRTGSHPGVSACKRRGPVHSQLALEQPSRQFATLECLTATRYKQNK